MSDETALRIRSLFPAVAALLALVGIVDSLYLTIHHYTAEPVPCSLVEGCETVLTSRFATLGGVPIAALGTLGYFAAFALAIFALFGRPASWNLYGIMAVIMAAVSVWLIYLQAFVIVAFCQFCLLSAATSTGLFLTYLASLVFRRS